MLRLAMWIFPKLLKYLTNRGVYPMIWYDAFIPKMATKKTWRKYGRTQS